MSREHEYLAAPTFLFEFAVNDGPPRISSRDLRVTDHEVFASGREVRVSPSAPDEHLSFELVATNDGLEPAVILALTVTSERLESAFLRMVMPKILGLRARGSPCDTFGMIPMEIGSNVRLAGTLARNGKPDEFDGTYNPGTIEAGRACTQICAWSGRQRRRRGLCGSAP